MNVIKYNVNSGDVCQIGRQYEYGKTQVIFEGYQVNDSANEIYFKFVGRTEDSKYLIPIIDMTLDITQQLTKHVGQFSCQLEEMNTEGTLVSQSPVFYVAVKRSIKVGADYEVQDPRLETIYQKYNAMYNTINDTNNTVLANESQRQAEWITLKQEVADAVASIDGKLDWYKASTTDTLQARLNGFIGEAEGSIQTALETYETQTDSNINDKLTAYQSKTTSDINRMFDDSDRTSKEKIDKYISEIEQRRIAGEFNGSDGYTPVKGKDYFTESEIVQFKKDVTPKKRIDYFTDSEISQIQNEVSSGAIGEFRVVVQTETDNFNTNAANKVSEFDAHTEQIQADVSELKSDLTKTDKLVYLMDSIEPLELRKEEVYDAEWEQGTVGTDGTESDSMLRIRTGFIPVGRKCFGLASTNGSILYTIRIYDANKTHLSNASATNSSGQIIAVADFVKYSIDVDTVRAIEPTAAYIRIVARKNDYTEIIPSECGMTFTYLGDLDTSRNLTDVFVAKQKDGRYSTDEITFTYDINAAGNYTKGFLKLPPNYESVKSVPLIVFIHGSSDVTSLEASQMTTSYNDYYNYLRDCGYAIFDCFGWGNVYSVVYGNTWGCPTNDLCYLNGIKYVCENYNIQKENIFVACKSLGGVEAYSLCYQNVIPIRATGLLAPELDILEPLPFGYHQDQRAAIATDCEFTGDWQSVLNVADASFSQRDAMTYMRTQGIAMQKYNPAWHNLLISENDKFDLSINGVHSVNGYKPTNVPVKIWIAEDDEAVSYESASYHVEQIRRAGGSAEIRTMPNNTGGHHSVDNAANAPQTTNVTTPLGIYYSTIPMAYYELELYFRSFRVVQ